MAKKDIKNFDCLQKVALLTYVWKSQAHFLKYQNLPTLHEIFSKPFMVLTLMILGFLVRG